MTAPIIEAKALSKWFGEVVTINNVDLVVEPGITGLLGSNGAGKSTFMKLALGLYAPSRGTIKVLGEAPRNNPNVLKRLGYCPEIDNFYDSMSGYEFVYWLCRYWGMTSKQAHKATEESCALVHMTDRMDDPIDEYSKGMRQRVKIAQALAPKPELLFLDEPMNGLDPQGREEMYDLIKHLSEQKYSVIVSSHILYEIERVTDTVVLMYNGSVLAQGQVKHIRDKIDEHPHTITIESNDPRGLSRHFVGDPAVMSFEFEDKKVTLRTRDPNQCYQRINDLAVTNDIDLRSVRCADDDLQSVFDYLIKS